ncbi:MAG: IPT/TIG domain-containing protein [Deltaproteobacteria bacterium]|nr:IPT/TIG domain-containing protein [Deltaproteobacteria bacterium]
MTLRGFGRTGWLALGVMVCVALAASANAASTFKLNDGQALAYAKGSHGVEIDNDGNVHIVTIGESDNSGPTDGYNNEPQVYYMMVAPDGDVLIDTTWITTGGTGSTDKAKPQLAWTDDTKSTLAVVWGEEADDVFLAFLNPSGHAQDGTDALPAVEDLEADGGNTGNGTMEVWTAAGATISEDWTLEFDGTDWTATGSVSGELPWTVTNGTLFPNTADNEFATPISFYATNGGTPFENGDKVTFSTVASDILSEPAGVPISDVDGTQSTHPRITLREDGNLYIMWRDEAYWNTGGELQYRTWNATDGLGDIQAFAENDASLYWGAHGEIREVYDGNTVHAVIGTGTTGNEDDANVVMHIRYTLSDLSDGSDLVAPSTIFVDRWNRRPAIAQLPNGNLFIAFQAMTDEDANTDNWYSRLFTAIIDPSVNGFDGSTLTPDVTPTVDAGNTGNGDISDITVALVAEVGTYTVTCTDDSVSGSEVWSVESPSKATLAEATTGVPYTTDTGMVSFLIEDGGTDFANGDSFTFDVAASPAVVQAPTIFEPGESYIHPSVIADPNGGGVLMVMTHKGAEGDVDFDYNEVFYAVLGYDGATLEGPTQVSDIDDPDFVPEWPAIPSVRWADDTIFFVWSEEENATNESYLVLGAEENPVDGVSVTSATPAEVEEGADASLTIAGTGFEDGATVDVGGTALTDVTVGSATEITGTLPAGLAVGSYDVTVTNPDTLFGVLADGVTVVTPGDDDDSGDDDMGGDDDAGDDDASGDDDDDDDGGCCGC